MRLSKADSRQHHAALKLLEKDALTIEDRYFVINNWREDATHMNGTAGAFFTPEGLARDLTIEVTGKRIVDLCAGIGSLALAAWMSDPRRQITCIEINRNYYDVGRKVLPEAMWICGDVFDYQAEADGGLPLFQADVKPFDCAISNPPFGKVKTHTNQHGYFEYDLIAKAREMADDGVFIIPQMSLPFRYSGRQMYETVKSPRFDKFRVATGIDISMNCGIDTSLYQDEWTIKPPPVEVALGFRGEE